MYLTNGRPLRGQGWCVAYIFYKWEASPRPFEFRCVCPAISRPTANLSIGLYTRSKIAKSLVAAAQQPFPVIGMSNIDQGFGALAQIFTIQICYAVLSDHVMDMPPCSDHAGPLPEVRHDARNTFAGTAGDGNDGFAAFAQRRAAHKIQLSADAAVLVSTDTVGTNLSGQVYLYGTVDGHHFGVAADDPRVVHVVNIEESDRRIVVHIIVQPACADGKGGNSTSVTLAP
jgi:hypothetical protein